MPRSSFLASTIYGIVAAASLASAPAGAASVSVCEGAGLTGNAGKEMYGPEGRLVTLAVGDTPASAGACATVALPVPAAAVRWFSLTELSVTEAPARLGLQGYFDAAEAQVSEVIYAQPAQLAEPGLLASNAPVTPQHALADAGRATWLWSPQLWLDAPDTAWNIAQRQNLRKLFITVPLSAAADVANAAQLAAFIRDANARGIEVWAVAGDRSDVLPESLPAVVARAAAYRAFNALHPDARLAGLQLDIEPYLLPGITLAPDYWRARYIDTIAAVHRELAGQLPLDLVMPVWWGTHPAWGAPLRDSLALPGLSLTVMNYRTDIDALRAGAMPFLAWGQEHGVKVAMALEQGRIGVNAGNGRDETRIDYAAVEGQGALWLLELGGVSVLLLLDAEHAGLPGQAYAQRSERVISTGTISFAGAPANLEAIAATLEAEWSAWEAFNGLAIHGLDQIDAGGR